VRVVGISVASALVVLALGTSVAAAHGSLQPGVHVDPGSPAAKEYDIPLNQATQLGSGSSSSSSGLQPGVHVDPGSPAAKEYDIPLNQASQLGSGSSSSSSGLQPGVHVDPGSPAAKEYAIPLNQAGASTPSTNGTTSKATLFGVGINPSGSGNSSGLGTSHTKARGGGVQTALPSVVVPGSSGSDGSLLALLGGGVAILVLGSFGGAVLRRSRHSPPT
jgi:hypothetical protein